MFSSLQIRPSFILQFLLRDIRQICSGDATPVFDVFLAQIRGFGLRATERYATNKDFKRYYDFYANQKLKEQIAQQCSGSLLWGTYWTQRLCSSKVITSFMGAKDT